MWEQAQQQAYDRGITIFSPDGRLYQVEYAREAVKRGTASLGVRTAEGVVLAADIRSRSALMEARSIEKLHKVDRHVGIASAGHVADGRRLIDFARRDAQVNRLRYDEPIDVETLAKHLSDVVQQYTQLGGTRPFGVALLIGGVTDGKRQLYELDPSGAITEWRAAAIGANRDQIQDHLEGHYADELSLDDGVELALAALAAGREEPLDAEGVNVAVVSAADGRYRTLEPEEVEKHLPDIPDDDAAAADGDEPEDADPSDEDEPDE